MGQGETYKLVRALPLRVGTQYGYHLDGRADDMVRWLF